jgi:hypothetical protein
MATSTSFERAYQRESLELLPVFKVILSFMATSTSFERAY